MDPLVKEMTEQFDKTVAALQRSFAKLRTGRANPKMLEGIQCDYYGDKMDITSLSNISMPEPRQLYVTPYSREDVKSIGAAIAAANLGINPQIEADGIRLIVPPLTEELRREIAKEAKALSEDAKVSVRNIRRDYLDMIKSDEDMTEDYQKRLEEEVQLEVNKANKRIEEVLKAKQDEIMSI